MAISLKLPSRWRIHDVFPVSLLEPYRESQKGLREKINLEKSPRDMDQDLDSDLDEEGDREVAEIMASSCD
jgi:hypothetical protein